MQHLISAPELQLQFEDSNLIILDCTISKIEEPASKEKKKRIPGARFFDIKNTFSDIKSAFPNMLPTVNQFQKECRKLGINNNSHIVVYDNLGIYSSARAWWMFRTMGHSKVMVLDGGLPAWEKEGFATEFTKAKIYEIGNFEAKLNADSVKDFGFIQSNILEQEALVIDARSADRFHSRVPEPRADLRRGNIEGSINIPYTELLANGKFKPQDQLLKLFTALIPETRPLVFSCGSGITACIVLLACESILTNSKAIYDGSWTEYAQLID